MTSASAIAATVSDCHVQQPDTPDHRRQLLVNLIQPPATWRIKPLASQRTDAVDYHREVDSGPFVIRTPVVISTTGAAMSAIADTAAGFTTPSCPGGNR